jgi:hypothetical protein
MRIASMIGIFTSCFASLIFWNWGDSAIVKTNPQTHDHENDA